MVGGPWNGGKPLRCRRRFTGQGRGNQHLPRPFGLGDAGLCYSCGEKPSGTVRTLPLRRSSRLRVMIIVLNKVASI